MRLVYEGVDKRFRKEFKHFLDFPKAKYCFKGSTATVELEEPYLITEQSIIEKNTFKRAMQQGIIEFRNYCFNN